jgi:hypothetical protein
LEAAAYGLGGRRGIILIPEGHGGWGWHKFSGELRKASEFLYAKVGCGSFSSDAFIQGGKEEGNRLGSTFVSLGSSFAAVVSSASSSVVKATPFEGGRHLRMRAPMEEPCALDLLPGVRSGEIEASRPAVDCSLLEIPPFDPLVMGSPLCPLGNQQVDACLSSCLNLNLCTWSKIFVSFKLALGRVFKKFLGCLAGSDLGFKRKGFWLGLVCRRLNPKPLFRQILLRAPV